MSPAPANGPLSGVLAATVTPMRDGGRTVDLQAIAELTRFLRAGGASGVFVAGTTGEGLLLGVEERMRLAERFVADAGTLRVAVHAGAQTTADATALAGHAREAGAAAVAAVGPPFYKLDAEELAAHFEAVASACAPLPFYLYEIRDRLGYGLDAALVRALRERIPNFTGMKVSNPRMEDVEPYAFEGLDLLVGTESLIPDALAAGAVGTVSGLAAALPEAVRRVLDGKETGSWVGALRARLARHPFQAALKGVLVARGVLADASVRAPLRALSAAEHDELVAWLGAQAVVAPNRVG
jgi:dihydrodipicolinate synthase/N-acetylneuraminate lyase